MVMVPEQIVGRRLAIEDYLALPDDQDYEIIEGVLYVAPRARLRHQIVANRLGHLLTGHTEDQGLGFVVPDADLIIDDRNTYVPPDIMYFSAGRFSLVDRDEMIRIVPDLIVEIISPTSVDHDYRTKRRTYAALGVPHYWVIDPLSERITEHVLQKDGTCQEQTVGRGEFRPVLFPDLVVDLGRLFA